MQNIKDACPRFKFETSNYHQKNYNCILLEGEIVHRITDVKAFHAHLGYRDEMRARDKILPDEFFWTEFHKDNSSQSEYCLQAKIIEYLKQESEHFSQVYGDQCKSWAGSCKSEKAGRLTNCANCFLLP